MRAHSPRSPQQVSCERAGVVGRFERVEQPRDSSGDGHGSQPFAGESGALYERVDERDWRVDVEVTRAVIEDIERVVAEVKRFWRVRLGRVQTDLMEESTGAPTCKTCRHGLEIAGTPAHPYWYCPQCRISALSEAGFYPLHKSANEDPDISPGHVGV